MFEHLNAAIIACDADYKVIYQNEKCRQIFTEEFKKAETKYKAHIKKSTIYELAYKPTNLRNTKGKKLVLLELQK